MCPPTYPLLLCCVTQHIIIVDNLPHGHFHLSKYGWCGLLYMQPSHMNIIHPFSITIYSQTFHYNTMGVLQYVYDDTTGSAIAISLAMYKGNSPVIQLLEALLKSVEI